jgi:hypothetical protein
MRATKDEQNEGAKPRKFHPLAILLGGAVILVLALPVILTLNETSSGRSGSKKGVAAWDQEAQKKTAQAKDKAWTTGEILARIETAKGDPREKAGVLADIAERADRTPPLVILAASPLHILGNQNPKPAAQAKALFWFYSGWLRAQSDVNLLVDSQGADAWLNAQAEPLIKDPEKGMGALIAANPAQAEVALTQAMAWDQGTPKNHDRQELGNMWGGPAPKNGSGVGTQKVTLFLGPNEWANQDKATRKDFVRRRLEEINQAKGSHKDSTTSGESLFGSSPSPQNGAWEPGGGGGTKDKKAHPPPRVLEDGDQPGMRPKERAR